MSAAVLAIAMQAAAAGTPLTVCADPNNLPFSNSEQAGFENRIAALIARELGRPITYVWWAQRRGYVRNTLGEQKCDIWPGVAAGVEMVATTRPYYRSSYMFVTRADKPLGGLTLDDPRLKTLLIGVQLVGNDAMNTPPAHAMANRGLTRNVRGYMIYGDYQQPNPTSAIVQAVAKGDIDVALVWGPVAGYFAKHSPIPLRLEKVTPWLDGAQWPMTYDISMGVRRDDTDLRGKVELILEKDAQQIAAILKDSGIPTESVE